MTRHFRLDGTATTLLIAVHDGEPRIVHWGSRLPAGENADAIDGATARPLARAALDRDPGVPLFPDAGRGYAGRPALAVHRAGRDWNTRLALASHTQAEGALTLVLADAAGGVELTLRLALDPATDILTGAATIRNTGATTLDVVECASLVLPVPPRLATVIASGGRWCRETVLERSPLPPRSYLAEQRTGRTSHANAPVLLLAENAADDDRGDVIAVALAWSGNHRLLVDRLPDGRRALHVGALSLPGEIRLAPGETWNAPEAHAATTADGLNGIRRLFHDFVRRRVLRPLRGPRRVHVNTWEALYFDHDPARLRALADAAAAVGVERYVLDDGWFLGRTDDRRALGDWTPDPAKYPDGLAPLIDHVRGLGMDFGLWVEPEMVNPNSELFRAHPDWILSVPNQEPLTGRHQYVLDLGRDEVRAHLFAALDALLRDHAISYLKWDMNRDLTAPGSAGRASVDRQTRALYALLDALRARHPAVEIESCASGGGRADLGILRRTDRVWTSDTNDAIERLAITRGFGLVFPPEVTGAHVGPVRAHTTGRRLSLAFQAAVSMFGHLGLELDVTALDEPDRDTLRRWIARYKTHRALLHDGWTRMLPADDPGLDARAVVARDGAEALVLASRVETSALPVPSPVRVTGLAPDAFFAVRIVEIAGSTDQTRGSTAFLDGAEAVLSGAFLAAAGIQIPGLSPGSAALFHLRRTGEAA